MAINIDASKPFPLFPGESKNRRESALDFFKRQSAGLPIVSDDMDLEKKDQEELLKIQKDRSERKFKLFYDNLGLILRHKDEILATPRYANIGVHYALKGGGLYVVPVQTSRTFYIAGSAVTVDLKLGSLLHIWATEAYRVKCECGCTAFVRSFSGSPLSGCSQASAYCPNCQKIIRVGNRSFGDYYGVVTTVFAEDVEKFAKSFIAKWALAEDECRKRAAEGNSSRRSRPGNNFKGDSEICNLETMINELKLKEYEKSKK